MGLFLRSWRQLYQLRRAFCPRSTSAKRRVGCAQVGPFAALRANGVFWCSLVRQISLWGFFCVYGGSFISCGERFAAVRPERSEGFDPRKSDPSLRSGRTEFCGAAWCGKSHCGAFSAFMAAALLVAVSVSPPFALSEAKGLIRASRTLRCAQGERSFVVQLGAANLIVGLFLRLWRQLYGLR